MSSASFARGALPRANASLVFVAASALAFVVHAVAIFGRDDARVACASVALPIGLAFLAMAILAVTAIGGFGVLAIIGLALT
ncbi:MAG: hypothetical protein ACKVWV_09710 [Planctomycetota bacterium]